jgi:hypothetical protein
MPGSPTRSITQPRPDRADARASIMACISSSRPTSGVRAPATPRCDAETRPTLTASTGSALPLTVKGSSFRCSKTVRDRSRAPAVARIWPGSARAISRAARFTASPMTV